MLHACASMTDEMSTAPVSAPDFPGSGRARRFAEGTAAVAVWMSLGMVWHMSAEGYLVLGIPITIGFQHYVRRAPLRAMWVRTAPPFRLGAGGIAIAILLTIKPLTNLVISIRSHEKLAVDAWLLAAMAGAWPAAYALRNFQRKTFRELLICLATAGTVGCAIMVAAAFALAGTHETALSRVRTGLAWISTDNNSPKV
jgi:hypothetical protein